MFTVSLVTGKHISSSMWANTISPSTIIPCLLCVNKKKIFIISEKNNTIKIKSTIIYIC